jgi:hypothetical protein
MTFSPGTIRDAGRLLRLGGAERRVTRTEVGLFEST